MASPTLLPERVTGREEEWRFTPLARVHGLADGAGEPTGKVSLAVDPAPGVVVRELSPGDALVGSVLRPSNRPGEAGLRRAMSEFTAGLHLQVPAGQAGTSPTTVRVTGEGATSFGHLVIEVGAGATATVVLDHGGSGRFYGNVELLVGDAASLTLVSIQDWAADATHLGSHAARLGRDARLRSSVVTLGGNLVRLVPTVQFAEQGGDAELLGLVFADAGQHLEHRLLVDHAVPNCRSRVTYKCALSGTGAHSVWVGDVVIRPDATGTDTYELNRNLLLTPDARADSVPNLEIETGEIAGAGHASATGRFDEEQLFYLMSRGISPEVATAMVVRGFFADVISRIGVPELEPRLLAAVDAELEQRS